MLPNNGNTVTRSYAGVDYYNPTTQKVLGDTMNDLYMATIVFKSSCANANQGYGHALCYLIPQEHLTSVYMETITFPKGNDVTHDVHRMFQYYVDSDFISNGSQWKITASGDDIKIWDIIFFFILKYKAMRRYRSRHNPSITSPRENRKACLCAKGNTYSRKCCKGNMINQGVGNIY